MCDESNIVEQINAPCVRRALIIGRRGAHVKRGNRAWQPNGVFHPTMMIAGRMCARHSWRPNRAACASKRQMPTAETEENCRNLCAPCLLWGERGSVPHSAAKRCALMDSAPGDGAWRSRQVPAQLPWRSPAPEGVGRTQRSCSLR